ncbi:MULTISPECIES: hypothetical protein [Streptomyces]|uniref:hypothetical protein n=1 Tax=Streptomyces lycopersici TaxID=2974589 RepID=UPI0021D0E3D6|nr:hypothetical protein [Streptomyces sp. NEAU-383]
MQTIRYQTSGGAVVTVAAQQETEPSLGPHRRVVRATCGGCGEVSWDEDSTSYERAAVKPKKWADEHAVGCRVLPQESGR